MADPVAEPAPTSRLPQIRENEAHWIWKAGIRAFLCVIYIVAIGCAAWILASTVNSYNDDVGDYTFPGSSAASVAVLCVAFFWCLLFLTIPFILKPPRPIHPGWAVGGDLLFWLGFIVVALFTTASIFNFVYFGSDGIIEDPAWSHSDYSGQYYLAPNGTWVYNITSVYNRDPGYGYYNYTSGTYDYPPVNTTGVVRDCGPEFSSCAQQDAYINKLWHQRSTMEGTTIVVAAVEWLGVLFHFILFVWACVDTHRYNAKKRVGTDQIIADKIIKDLEKRGLIQVKNGVVVSASGAPNSSSQALVTAPLLAPEQTARHGSTDAITPV